MHAIAVGETGEARGTREVGMKRVGDVLRPEWFTPRDARLLGRLRTGQPVNEADLTGVSREFQPIASRILAASWMDREELTDEWLRGCDDAEAEAIERAVIDREPMQPSQAVAGREEAIARSLGLDVRLTRVSDIVPRKVEWLWRGRVPSGMLTMFAGDPKLGKSYVTLTIAAAVSRGASLPDGDVPTRPASAINLSAEDDPSRTIVPRLIAAGADLTQIHHLESVVLDNRREAALSLDTDIAAIAAAAERLGDCRLILIDPITAYLGRVDDHRNAGLRSVLTPLNDMAERLDVAVVLVSHLNKGSGTNGRHRVMGSIAYVGTCRANFVFIRDRTDPTGRRVLFCDNGGNLGPVAPTLAYTIEEREFGPRVEFLDEPVAMTVEQALADEVEAALNRRLGGESREAEQWLHEILAAGPLPPKTSWTQPGTLDSASRPCSGPRRALASDRPGKGSARTRSGSGASSRPTPTPFDRPTIDTHRTP
jgi:putative DNA primase/helicase